ncbi:MAG: GTP-binding protein [Pseudomonadota bacterium]
MAESSKKNSERLPISILSGFLGSGKTTVLNHLMGQPELSRTLVIINEFGEVGLDHDLMVHSTDDVVVEMSNGCLCCTLRRDLAKTLREAPWRFARGGELWFDRVIIETTGIADPAPILNTLMTDPKISGLYRLDGVVVTVDAANGLATLDSEIDAVKQAAVADRLLITKTDLVDSISSSKLQDRLRALNPSAKQDIARRGVVDAGSLFDIGLYDLKTKSLNVQNWISAETNASAPDRAETFGDRARLKRHAAEIRSVCLTIDEPIDRQRLDVWFEALRRFDGADLLRMKGIVSVTGSDGPLVIHGVQHVFHPVATLQYWPSEDRRSRIVFITRNIDEASLHDTLKVLTGTETARPEVSADTSGASEFVELEGRR